jgi:Cu+-exporting ATPase
MDVDPSSAQHTLEHGGKTYSFCSGGCQTAFAANPRKYLDTGYKASMLGAMWGRIRGLFGMRA